MAGGKGDGGGESFRKIGGVQRSSGNRSQVRDRWDGLIAQTDQFTTPKP